MHACIGCRGDDGHTHGKFAPIKSFASALAHLWVQASFVMVRAAAMAMDPASSTSAQQRIVAGDMAAMWCVKDIACGARPV